MCESKTKNHVPQESGSIELKTNPGFRKAIVILCGSECEHQHTNLTDGPVQRHSVIGLVLMDPKVCGILLLGLHTITCQGNGKDLSRFSVL